MSLSGGEGFKASWERLCKGIEADSGFEEMGFKGWYCRGNEIGVNGGRGYHSRISMRTCIMEMVCCSWRHMVVGM